MLAHNSLQTLPSAVILKSQPILHRKFFSKEVQGCSSNLFSLAAQWPWWRGKQLNAFDEITEILFRSLLLF